MLTKPMSVFDYFAYINTTQLHRVAVILFVVLLGVGMGVGFSVASTNARTASDADYNNRLAIFSQWQMDLTSHLTKAGSIAATVASFVFSTAITPANMSAPAADRVKIVNPEAFKRICAQVNMPGVTSIALASGGVLSQIASGVTPTPIDMYKSITYKHFFPTLMNKTGLLTGGPSKMTTRPGYGTFIFFPVHVSNVTSIDTFWGLAYILIEIPALMSALNISSKMASQNMDFTMWFTTKENGTVPTIFNESNPAVSEKVMAEGLRMLLPISEEGRASYLAIYPRGGPVSPHIQVSTAVTIVAATLFGSAAVLVFIYACTYAHFLFRHRRAPANHSTMYVGALALRGAQPIADRAPLVAVRMFNDFNAAVRTLAVSSGCYPVCEIGDRCMYVVTKDPANLMRLAQAAVLEITVLGTIPAGGDLDTKSQTRRRPSLQRSTSYARTVTHVSKAAHTTVSQISEDMTQSSFVGTATCHPSVACHTMEAMRVYDAARDSYFYGSAAQLNKLCCALDMAKGGEVCWTDAFESKCPTLCREASSTALTSHTVSENGKVVLHVASWWRESGDERDNEDPSTAMAVLTDAYMRRMTVIVSEGKAEAKDRKRKDGGETRSGSSSKGEATALLRTATLLHVAVINGDEKTALEVVRRIVTEEKGTVVSAHEATIVAAFNLLSAGGHHQIRAADSVMRLRDALPDTQFACSIQHGKINALMMDGLVMCTGDAVTHGRALLQIAVDLSTLGVSNLNPADGVTYLPSDSDVPKKLIQGVPKRRSEVGAGSGLCLLCCHSELSSTYDCEAVDVAALGAGKPRIVYRLAFRRSGKATDDEWMYRMKDDEDHNPYAVVNAVFAHIASHDLEEARRLWGEHVADGGSQPFEVSAYAKAALARHLKPK